MPLILTALHLQADTIDEYLSASQDVCRRCSTSSTKEGAGPPQQEAGEAVLERSAGMYGYQNTQSRHYLGRN